MSVFRHQLPVYSPLSARAVRAAFGTGDSRSAVIEILKAEYGASEVILTDSGTSALALALKAATLRRPGQPCALPAYACYDLATAALAAGVDVALYDLDPFTLAPEPSSLRRALHRGAAALVTVHLYGVPVPMNAMQRAAQQADALLIEDAAQGIGGSWDGRPLGASGALGVLSFGRGKGITGGGGGALLVYDAAALGPDRRCCDIPLATPATSAMFGIKLFAQWLLGRPEFYGVPASIPRLRLGETVFQAPRPVRGMPAAVSRVLIETMQASLDEVIERRRNASRIRAALEECHGVHLVNPVRGGTPGWLRLPVLVSSRFGSSAGRLGIMQGYPRALSELPELTAIRSDRDPMVGAERLARELWTLPTHTRLTEADLERMAQSLLRDR